MHTIDLRTQAVRFIPALPALPALRDMAIATWSGRMKNEYGSARVFEALARQLDRAGLSRSTVETCRGFAAEERRHGVLGGAVVEALGGEAVTVVTTDDEVFPEHADAAPLEAALRNLLSISCLSETIAVSLIGAERLEMPEGELRDLLTSIYSDEVGHARFGWRLVREIVPTLDAATRERLGEYLEVAFAHLETHELSHLPANACPPPEGKVLGLCSGKSARSLFYATVAEVIIPALEGYGLPAARAWADRDRAALAA